MFLKKSYQRALFVATLSLVLLFLELKFKILPNIFYPDGRPIYQMNFKFILGLWLIFFLICFIIFKFFEKPVDRLTNITYKLQKQLREAIWQKLTGR